MRKIKAIVIHCSDTPAKMNIGAEEIDRWHRERGWKGIGYHYVIRRDGDIEDGRPVEKRGAHVAGHNNNTIGICLVGRKTFTKEQWAALTTLVIQLQSIYKCTVRGHRDYTRMKSCPNFDVRRWWKDVEETLNDTRTT